MQLKVQTELEVPAEQGRVFDVIADQANLPKIFQRSGLIPGVARCETAPPDASGRPRRQLVLTDGSAMQEEILLVERPTKYGYRWVNKPSALLSRILGTVETTWELTTTRGGSHTHVCWTYYFELTALWAYPLVLVLLSQYRRWMLAAVDRIRTAVAESI
jgi:hypothetical protein